MNKQELGKKQKINIAIYNVLKITMKYIDNKIFTGALFMDLTKAFDYVDHSVLLLQKLHL